MTDLEKEAEILEFIQNISLHRLENPTEILHRCDLCFACMGTFEDGERRQDVFFRMKSEGKI